MGYVGVVVGVMVCVVMVGVMVGVVVVVIVRRCGSLRGSRGTVEA